MAEKVCHYRASIIGQELEQSIDDFIREGLFDEDEKEMIMEIFERTIHTALASWVKTEARVRGPLRQYRNASDIWAFFLENVQYKADGSTISSPKGMKIVTISSPLDGDEEESETE